jgi:hypothetical protein
MNKIVVLIVIFLTMTSCTVVKEYEKELINDPEMKLASKSSERYDTTFQVYREAAAGANGRKTGGGCGCN